MKHEGLHLAEMAVRITGMGLFGFVLSVTTGCAAMSSSRSAEALIGTWYASGDTEMGWYEFTLTFRDDGEVISSIRGKDDKTPDVDTAKYTVKDGRIYTESEVIGPWFDFTIRGNVLSTKSSDGTRGKYVRKSP